MLVSVIFLRINMKLFIATPCYGGMMTMFTAKSLMGLTSLLTEKKIDFQFYGLANEALIPRARNYCVEEFLRSDATYLMFIDSDIIFKPEDVLKLLDDDKNIIGAAYPRKERNGGHVGGEGNGIQRVDYLGTGFLMIKREVFEGLKDDKIKYYPDHQGTKFDGQHSIYAFFDCGIVDSRYLSEDYMFCHRAKEKYTIWIDYDIKLKHVGMYFYA